MKIIKKIAKVFLVIIIVFIGLAIFVVAKEAGSSLFLSCMSDEADSLSPTSPPVETPPPEGYISWDVYYQLNELPPEGWDRITVRDVGHIDYPAELLERQPSSPSGDVLDRFLIKASGVEGKTITHFVLQQAGLNDLSILTYEGHKRVACWTYHLEADKKVLCNGEEYSLSQKELEEFDNCFYGAVGYLSENTTLVETYPVEIIEVNDMYSLLFTYTMREGDSPLIKIYTYMFMDYDMIHYLLFANTVDDDLEYKDVYERMLNSFTLY